MTNNSCSFVHRCYSKMWDRYFFNVSEEETALFKSKRVPIVIVPVSKGISYYVEVLDFLNTVLPEIGFNDAFIYTNEGSTMLCAHPNNNSLCKHSLDILGLHCKDYMLESNDGCNEDGEPLGAVLSLFIPLN